MPDGSQYQMDWEKLLNICPSILRIQLSRQQVCDVLAITDRHLRRLVAGNALKDFTTGSLLLYVNNNYHSLRRSPDSIADRLISCMFTYINSVLVRLGI